MIYQIKITLDRIRPPVWRRIQLPGNITLEGLHQIIQSVMGWEDYHLHEFRINRDRYGPMIDDDFDMDLTADDSKVKLCDVVTQEKTKFSYVYDFGDDWRHTLIVEKIVPADSDVDHPTCLKGKRACPPEDCGGPWGYEEILEAQQHPDNPRYAELLEWAGDFDPEAFDLDAVNTHLRRFRRSPHS